MSTNAPEHPAVAAHSHYFDPGSTALENIVDVVTGQYDDIVRHRAAFPEIAGGLVAWALRMPVAPLQLVGPPLPGPGFPHSDQLVPLRRPRSERDGNLVCGALDEGERALLWFAHRVGALEHPARTQCRTPMPMLSRSGPRRRHGDSPGAGTPSTAPCSRGGRAAIRT